MQSVLFSSKKSIYFLTGPTFDLDFFLLSLPLRNNDQIRRKTYFLVLILPRKIFQENMKTHVSIELLLINIHPLNILSFRKKLDYKRDK